MGSWRLLTPGGAAQGRARQALSHDPSNVLVTYKPRRRALMLKLPDDYHHHRTSQPIDSVICFYHRHSEQGVVYYCNLKNSPRLEADSDNTTHDLLTVVDIQKNYYQFFLLQNIPFGTCIPIAEISRLRNFNSPGARVSFFSFFSPPQSKLHHKFETKKTIFSFFVLHKKNKQVSKSHSCQSTMTASEQTVSHHGRKQRGAPRTHLNNTSVIVTILTSSASCNKSSPDSNAFYIMTSSNSSETAAQSQHAGKT